MENDSLESNGGAGGSNGNDNGHWYENFAISSLILFVVSLLLLGGHWALVKYTDPEYGQSLISFIFKEAGMAGLVALFLNFTIEWANRRRHSIQQRNLLSELEKKNHEASLKLVKNVNEHIFKTIYERNIDPKVFQQVEDHLLRAKIMRKGYVASFKLSPFSGSGDRPANNLVQITFTTRYKVFNLTDDSITVDVIKAIVDVTPEYRAECYFKRATVNGETLQRDDLDKGYFENGVGYAACGLIAV